jgi:hypothetical protein
MASSSLILLGEASRGDRQCDCSCIQWRKRPLVKSTAGLRPSGGGPFLLDSSFAEFQDWANRVAEQFNYSVRFLPVGSENANVGTLLQMATIDQKESAK